MGCFQEQKTYTYHNIPVNNFMSRYVYKKVTQISFPVFKNVYLENTSTNFTLILIINLY